MTQRARKVVALVVSAALTLGGLPAAALDAPAPSQDARELFRRAGISEEAVRRYLISGEGLTTLGRLFYRPLKERDEPDGHMLQEEGRRLNEKLTALGGSPVNEQILRDMRKKLGAADRAYSPGDSESNYQYGREIEAALPGGQAPARGGGDHAVTRREDGSFVLRDAKGGTTILGSDGKTLEYSSDLRKQQKEMNSKLPPGASWIPETGRHNKEMLFFEYWQLKSAVDERLADLEANRRRQLAQILGEDQILSDMLDERLSRKLEEMARRKSYEHEGRKMSVLEYVDNVSLRRQKENLEESLVWLARYRRDLDVQAKTFGRESGLSESGKAILERDKTRVLKHYRIATGDSQLGLIRTFRHYLDPDAPDFETYAEALKAMGQTPERVEAFTRTLREDVKPRHERTESVLEKALRLEETSDLSQRAQKVAEASSRAAEQVFRRFYQDMLIYHDTLSQAQTLRAQADVNWLKQAAHGAFARAVGVDSGYAKTMRANQRDWSQMTLVIDALADGDVVSAKRIVIDMHPEAARNAVLATSDPSQITDALRVEASFKAITDNVNFVNRTNRWLDLGVTVVEYSVGIASVGGVAGYLLSGAGKAMLGGSGLGRAVSEKAAQAAQTARALWAKATAGGLSGAGALVEKTGFVGREIARHIGTNLGLIRGAEEVSLLARVGGLAVRQTLFLSSSYALMGSYAALEHGWKGEDSLYSSALSAFVEGGESNVFFFGGVDPRAGPYAAFLPMIMFVSLPATAFRGIPLFSRLAETVANNGAVGIFSEGGKWAARGVLHRGSRLFEWAGLSGWAAKTRAWRGAAWLATAEEQAQRKIFTKGLYERLGEHGAIGRTGAYGLMQADGLMRFMGLNWMIGKAGWAYGYWLGRWSGEQDLAQRLKGANATSLGWQQGYWWAFLPQRSAYETSQQMSAYRAFEAAKEYEKAGSLAVILNAGEGDRLPFKSRPSWWKRLTDPYPRGDSFTVDSNIKDWAVGKALVRVLGGRNAEDVHFMELHYASRVQDGADEVYGLKANADLRAAAVSAMVTSMVKNPGKAAKFLEESALGRFLGPNGEPVAGRDGYRVTPEIQESLAFSLLAAPNLIGESAPRPLLERAQAILERYVESARRMDAPAQRLAGPIQAAALKSTSLEAALKGLLEGVEEITRGRSGGVEGAPEKLGEIQARLARQPGLDAASLEVVDGIVKYVQASYERFGYANTPEQARARLLRILTALGNEYEGESARGVHDVVNGWRGKVEDWFKRHASDTIADNQEAGPANHFQTMVRDFLAEAKAAKSLPEGARRSLEDAVEEMGGAPWVVRDDKKFNMTGWRAEQLNGLVELLSAYALQSGDKTAEASRLYQLIATGGGKTLVQFVGLLPLAEALFNQRGLDRLLYATIPPLKAQAVNDFVAFKVAGTRLEFVVPEDIKADIAQGKLSGRDVASRNMLIGDEADKFLFEDPQTSLGGLAGSIRRLASAYHALDERQAGLAGRLDMSRRERVANISTAARRVLDLALRGDGAKEEAGAVRAALKALDEARGPQTAAAEADVAAKTSILRARLSAPEGSATSEALRSLEAALGVPPPGAAARKEALAALVETFKRDLKDLRALGSQEGVERLLREASASAVLLGREANASGAKVDLFESFASKHEGQRLALLQDKIAETAAENPAAPQLKAWGAEVKALLGGLTSEAWRRSARDHQAAAKLYYKSRRALTTLGDDVSRAMRENDPAAAAVKARYGAAAAELEVRREEARRFRQALSQGAVLPRGAEIIGRLKASQERILEEARGGRAGWEQRAGELLEARRELLRAYAGSENPLYAAMRGLQESVRPLAYREGVDKDVKNPKLVAELEREIDGRPLFQVWPAVLRMFWQTTRWGSGKIDPGGADVGLVRKNAAELLGALRLDRGMPAGVKSDLFWEFAWSLLRPKGLVESSWVRRELLNQFQGFFEPPMEVYHNQRNGEVFTRFNGQVIPNMDIPTRRYWELRHGADLTLPYEHLAVGGAEDLIRNRKANYFLFSATVEDTASKVLAKEGVRVSGSVVIPEEKPVYRLAASAADNHVLVRRAIDAENPATGGRYVAVNRSLVASEAGQKEVSAYLESKGLDARAAAFAAEIKELQASRLLSAETKRSLLSQKNQKGLVSVACSDTEAVMEMRGKLIAGGLKPEEIAMVFSDVQYEKANGDAKKVASEMNLEALGSGRAKVLLIDSSYVLRGLDLKFKGERRDFQAESFAGYNHVTMLLFGVQKNTAMQVIQFVGRTAPRRMLPGVKRDYVISADIQTARSENALRLMQGDAEYRALLKASGASDWAGLNAHIQASSDKALSERYDALIEKHLRLQWDDVSKQKMSASGFGKTAPPDGRFPVVEALAGRGK